MGTRIQLVSSTAVVLVALHACGGDSSDDDDTPTVSGTSIGTSGGDVSEAALTLNVPAGALSAPVTITVEETSTVDPPAGLMLVGPAYDLGPDGTQFAEPVLVTIDLGVGFEFGQVTLYHSSNGTNWVPAEDSAFERRFGALTGYITHFSLVAPFAPIASGAGGATGAGGVPSTGNGGDSYAGGAPGTGAGGEAQTGGAVGTDGGAGGSSACGALTECGGSCVDLMSDPLHCNDCNISCAIGELCLQGQCLALDAGYCGDAEISGSEQCDDGNNNPGDGCSPTCMIEYGG